MSLQHMNSDSDEISKEEFLKVIGRKNYWYMRDVHPSGKGVSITIILGQYWGDEHEMYHNKYQFYHIDPPGFLMRLISKKTFEDRVNEAIERCKRICYNHNKKEYDVRMLCKPH